MGRFAIWPDTLYEEFVISGDSLYGEFLISGGP